MDKATYFLTLREIRESLPADAHAEFDLAFQTREKNPTIALLLSLSFGVFAVDRFYIGQISIALIKLLLCVLSGGIAAVIDLFLIMAATRGRNIEIATEIASEIKPRSR